MGICRYCQQPAGFLHWQHPQCRDIHTQGLREMTELAARAASGDAFSLAALRQSLQDIAERSHASSQDIGQALSEGFAQSVAHALQDGIMTRDEEQRLRTFRDQLALHEHQASLDLERAAGERLTREAQLAAISPQDQDFLIHDLIDSLRDSGLNGTQQHGLLVHAWEAAVENALEDGIIPIDEEAALAHYANFFTISHNDLDRNGAQASLIQAAVIRDVTQGIVPRRRNVADGVPFHLMKSETMIWVIQDVDYLETGVRRERRDTSPGAPVPVARGLYYRPSTFRSRPIEWEETVHQDTGFLGLTTKHIYFAGSRRKFRVRYDRIVSFDPYDDGLGIMRDALTAKPQTFRTGDGWFVYNLAVNLARMQR